MVECVYIIECVWRGYGRPNTVIETWLFRADGVSLDEFPVGIEIQHESRSRERVQRPTQERQSQQGRHTLREWQAATVWKLEHFCNYPRFNGWPLPERLFYSLFCAKSAKPYQPGNLEPVVWV